MQRKIIISRGSGAEVSGAEDQRGLAEFEPSIDLSMGEENQ